ncbi:hypothetical protein [Hymenobacter cellulosilyticus]|uniref:DUF1571 domain-containing protein n=1 Tax=Hymenobacter cellulosilyticus TaxID=2932248 RepID=A0A8T9Q310_9BACT|nr:hypothetical protein [Hymenobacter cellulosilyticus]UOQ71425.1 hypothetical protein MUN79_22815 [Hymenobacter cellulosilyticus]
MRLLFCFAPLLLLTSAAHAKTPQAIEQELVKAARRLTYWADYDGDARLSAIDSLARAGDKLRDKLLYYTATEPSTLTYAFPALQREHITISTAADGRMRIYSWDTLEGGTMHYFENVVQFRAGAKVGSRRLIIPKPDDNPDAGHLYFDLFPVQRGGQTYYLAYGQATYSSAGCYQHVKALTIENGQLNPDAKLIQTQSGLRNTLGFEFDFSSVMNRPERPVRLITYDPKTRVLEIPVVWADGKVTAKRIRYAFNGTVFEKAK